MTIILLVAKVTAVMGAVGIVLLAVICAVAGDTRRRERDWRELPPPDPRDVTRYHGRRR